MTDAVFPLFSPIPAPCAGRGFSPLDSVSCVSNMGAQSGKGLSR